MRKCPSGILCISNMKLLFFIFFLVSIILAIYMGYINGKHKTILIQKINNTSTQDINKNNGLSSWIPNFPYNNLGWNSSNLGIVPDALINPYAPPLRDDRYFMNLYGGGGIPYIGGYAGADGGLGKIPINISTNPNIVETNFRQVGILTPTVGSSKDNILPLMGRPIDNRRSTWQYYTISNQHNNIKLPIKIKGRNALQENGVMQVNNKEYIFIEGDNAQYKTTLYENDTMRYLPFL